MTGKVTVGLAESNGSLLPGLKPSPLWADCDQDQRPDFRNFARFS